MIYYVYLCHIIYYYMTDSKNIMTQLIYFALKNTQIDLIEIFFKHILFSEVKSNSHNSIDCIRLQTLEID